ncbi:MAG: hypothetical protein KA477_02245 [Candidatus Levybacteria bacterium]|nr:hypothetical protein [Candidatus Levybacteria bacterium]
MRKFCPGIIYLILFFFLFAFPSAIFAQDQTSYSNLEEKISSLSFTSIFISTFLLVSFALISLYASPLRAFSKKLLFILISTVAIGQTLLLAGSTIYVNAISHSKGPVHFHADLEIFHCGTKIDLENPTGFSNKIGTSTLHEHNDFRIHLEGVVVEENDQSLGKFFHVIGGNITNDSLTVPTTNGMLSLKNGDLCPDGTPGILNVFLYKTVDKTFIQQKINDPAHYIYASEGQVPSGDCIIIEYGPDKSSTDKLCTSYQVAESVGKVKNGGKLND